MLPNRATHHISLVENHHERVMLLYKFRVNRFKRDNSRKHRPPIWSVIISCTFVDCKSKAFFSINSDFENHMTFTFEGQIKHATREVKR